jgi:hypothetical protein
MVTEDHTVATLLQQLLLGGVELVHRWFLWEDLLLQRVGGVIVVTIIIREQQPLPPRWGLSLLLQLAFVVVVVGCHSLEMREFREGEIDRWDTWASHQPLQDL